MSARVGLLQLRIDAAEPVVERVARVLELVRQVTHGGFDGVEVVAAPGAHDGRRLDVLVLPELWTVGAFDAEAMLGNPESIDGLLVQELRSIARDTSTWIHAGSLPEQATDGSRFNTSVLIDRDGEVDAVYRKIHLFGFDAGEAAMLTAGADLLVRPTPLGPTGLATCYDLRFPELFRGLVDAGAETFLLTSGWPQARITHWKTLLMARAIENLAWVVACNEVGTHAGVLLGGCSRVVDPWGQVLVEGPADRECLVVADVEPGRPAAARAEFPVLRDRRL